jgi:hypothetical protein
VKYIDGQEELHKKQTFRGEYAKLLKPFAVKYNEKYLFTWVEDEVKI